MDIKELMKRYNFKTTRGARYFISRHIEEINADGIEHAKQTSEGWQFDDIAVQKIDKLRGLSQIAIVDIEESERIKELKAENENLKNLLLMTQNKLLQKQEELNESQKQLLTAEKKYLLAESSSKDYKSELKIEEIKRENLEEKLLSAEVKSKNLEEKFISTETQLKNLQTEIEKIKKRGLLDRVFNNL